MKLDNFFTRNMLADSYLIQHKYRIFYDGENKREEEPFRDISKVHRREGIPKTSVSGASTANATSTATHHR